MSDPLPYRGKKLLKFLKKQLQSAPSFIKKNNFLFIIVGLAGLVLAGKMLILRSTPYAQAYFDESLVSMEFKSPIFEKKNLFDSCSKQSNSKFFAKPEPVQAKVLVKENQPGEMEKHLFDIVGDTPIAEMIPFIAKRDSRVAAFLIGIAKKESSFGLASPSKDGSTCYNFWGYKGKGSRGTSLGYSCFGSAEEAVETVGNRIEVLVSKDRNTPAKMVDTWKCGRSCSGDPGAPGWVSTVALYFEKIVSSEG
jgi:hypothetical protein